MRVMRQTRVLVEESLRSFMPCSRPNLKHLEHLTHNGCRWSRQSRNLQWNVHASNAANSLYWNASLERKQLKHAPLESDRSIARSR